MVDEERSQAGIALTEFVVAVAVFVTVLLAVADFGSLFVQQLRVNNAIREIGRANALLETEDCYEKAHEELSTRLTELGYDTSAESGNASVAGGYVVNPENEANLDGLTFLQLVVNAEIDTLTNAINAGEPILYVKSYTFLVEHPDVCSPAE